MSNQPSNSNFWRRLGKFAKWLLLGILLLALILVVVWGSFIYYLQTDEHKEFENVTLLNGGAFSFQQADFQLFSTFPQAGFTLDSLQIYHPDKRSDDHRVIELARLRIALSFQDWWDDPLHQTLISIDTIALTNGNIDFYRDSTGYSNLLSLIKRKTSPESKKRAYKLRVETEETQVLFKEINFELVNEMNNSHIHAIIDSLHANLNIKDQHLRAQTDFSIFSKQLGFNVKNGVYAPDTWLFGSCEIEYKDGNLEILPFPLGVDDQCFDLSVLTKIREENITAITFENADTRLAKALPLLPDTLRQQIAPYHVEQPFYSKTTIETAFQPNDHPIVTVLFKLKNHDIAVHDFAYQNMSLDGKFVNRIYQDERARDEARQRWRLEISDLNGGYQDFKIKSDTLSMLKTQDGNIRLKAIANITGKVESVSQWLEAKDLLFQDGKFKLKSRINGSLQDYEEIVRNSTAQLEMQDLAVHFIPADATFPFSTVQLRKGADQASFYIVGSTANPQHTYTMTGGVQNLTALLLPDINEAAPSEIHLRADRVGWTDFVDMFGEKPQPKQAVLVSNESQKKQSLKRTLSGLHNRLQPILTIEIDTIDYFDKLQLHAFQTGAHFVRPDSMVLEKTSFRYLDGSVTMSARMDISQQNLTPFQFGLDINELDLATLLPQLNYLNINLLKELETPLSKISLQVEHRGIMDDLQGLSPNSSAGQVQFAFLGDADLVGDIHYTSSRYDTDFNPKNQPITRTKVNLAGSPRYFNDLFQTEDFIFQNGRFKTQLDYAGDLYDFKELLAESKVDLQIDNSQIYYTPSEVIFPIPRLQLDVQRDSAAFKFALQSDSLYQPLNFVGNIHPLTELMIGETNHPIATNVNVFSKKLSWGNFQELIATSIPTDTLQNQPAQSKKSAGKNTVRNLFLRFHPHVDVQVDTLIYSDKIVLEQLTSGILMDANNQIILEKTGFQFSDGAVQMQGKFDLQSNTHTPFTTEIKADSLNIGKLLSGFNYLSLPSLQTLDSLNGKLQMDLHFSGSVNADGTGLIPSDNAGALNFDLRNLQVVGFDPLEKLAAKVRMKKRFQNLRFAPIGGTFQIAGDRIFFPLTEVHSNAFQLFLEGRLSYGDDTNMWVSLPFFHLFFNDINELPKKAGYHAHPLKIHAEVTSDENGENQFKLHFTKKKFYKQRGILEQYKLDKKRWRQLRKSARKNN
ncbi:MAG: hypothetical protein AB8G22_21825 [Saprospiraceae bacterium]